jgi:hypothetical protein
MHLDQAVSVFCGCFPVAAGTKKAGLPNLVKDISATRLSH